MSLAPSNKERTRFSPRTFARSWEQLRTARWGFATRLLSSPVFAGAFRRSELARICVSDLSFTPDGVVIDLRVSKTDQEGVGRKVGIPFGKDLCPVLALQAWLTAAKITEGPVFRRVDRNGSPSRRRGLHKDSIGKLLKRAAARADMDVAPLGGHALRAGCVTQAAMNGVREFVIMKQTGHKAEKTLRRDIRNGEISAGAI